jgi:archaemetzincin
VAVGLKIGLLPIGQVDSTLLIQIEEGLAKVFPETTYLVFEEPFALPEAAFDKTRKQYRSNQILGTIQSFAAKTKKANRILGVLDVDIFVPELNFVFGEASFPGKAALISLFRLKPEFYKLKPDPELFFQRAVKEAVHEIGHTLGLKHCSRSSCVMHFSNSIFDTDKKQNLFCDECYLKVALAINGLEKMT